LTKSLKIRGKIIEGPEDIPKGYHTFDINVGSIIEIYKEFDKEEINELLKSEKEKDKILLISFDNYECAIALISNFDYQLLDYFESEISKENYENEKLQYYSKIYQKIKEYSEKYNVKLIILASPIFWKNDLLEYIKKKDPELIKKIRLMDISYGGEHGIREALRRKEFLRIIEEFEVSKINDIFQEFLYRLSKGERIAYGYENVKIAIDSNAVEKILITEDFIYKAWREDFINELKNYIKKARRQKAEVFFVRKGFENYDMIQKLGGIIALLRFDIF